jgi:filamentous hemagglutinin family protein
MCTRFNHAVGNRKVFKKHLTCLTIVVFMAYQLMLCSPVYAAPEGGVVTSGTATISSSGNVTNIDQSSQNAAINWQSFSVKPVETVNFNQPNVSSITLNRVIGNERSIIEGTINATGRVFLLNSNGILFTGTSSVNTAGFIASTLNITDEDFNAGNYVFTSSGSTGSVINMGTITAREGGYVALLGNSVSNQGVISATKGTVALASGDKITLNFNGDSLLDLTIDEGTLNALVENKEAIYADGGKVLLTAKAADDLLSAQVNNTGIIQARTIDDLEGTITLYAYNGTTTVDGTLDASAPTSGDGGFIETSGDKVKVNDGAVITTASAYGKTGTWLIDPTNFTIVEGSASQTDSGMGAETLENSLATTNMTITTASTGSEDGDINVNAALIWWADTTLSLNAANDINVNAAIAGGGTNAGLNLTAGNNLNINKEIGLGGTNAVMNLEATTGDINVNAKLTTGSGSDASIAMTAGNDINVNGTITQDGANTSLAMTAGNDININNAITLSGDNAALTMNYGNDYNILTEASYSGTTTDADGNVVAKEDTSGGVYGSITFTSTNNTNGLTINGTSYTLIHDISQLATTGTLSDSYALAEDLDATEWSAANTGTASVIAKFSGTLTGLGHTISNLTLNAPSTNYVGLIGQTVSGATTVIRNIGLVDVNVTGKRRVGALIGWANGTNTISGVYSTGTVSGYNDTTGGLIGRAYGGTTAITDSYSTADITLAEGSGYVGGLIGSAENTTITNCHATGKVTGTSSGSRMGGLVGYCLRCTVSNSYATGAVTSTTGDYVGGLIGQIYVDSDSVTNSFATGSVTGGSYVGGLIGDAHGALTVDNTWASGNVTAEGDYVGGLIGYAGGLTITNSHATMATVTGGDNTGGLIGYLDGSVANSYATASVTGNGTVTGGLVGRVQNGSITGCYAKGNVTGGNRVGGLVGLVGGDSNVTDSWASGDVSGSTEVGGLAGYASGTIANSYATGNVVGDKFVGGLIGDLAHFSTVTDSYALGDVMGVDMVGGLVGKMNMGSSISDSYALGHVTGVTNTGGLVGYAAWDDGAGPTSITNSYWNVEVSGQSSAVGGSEYNGEVTPGSGPTVLTGTKGLTNSQWNDLQYYRDGTIDQVLTDRAVAATQQAAFESSATTQGGQTTGQALYQQDGQSQTAYSGTNTSGRQQPSSVGSGIVFVDSDSYSATIKSINVEGTEYGLEEKK